MNILFKVGKDRTYININNVRNLNIPSSILFQDAAKISERFKLIFETKLKIKDYSIIEQIIIIIPGKINSFDNIVIKSDLLNGFTLDAIYDGLNFNKLFSDIIPANKIFLISEINAFANGLIGQDKSLQSAVCITLNEKTEIAFINCNNLVLTAPWSNSLIPVLNMTIEEAIGKNGINDILTKPDCNVFLEYSYRINEVLTYLKERFERFNSKIDKVILIGEINDYLDESFIRNKNPLIEIKFLKEIEIVNDKFFNGMLQFTASTFLHGIPKAVLFAGTAYNPLLRGIIAGWRALKSADKKAKNDKIQKCVCATNSIIRIEYYSNDISTKSFHDFQSWKIHYISAKQIVSEKNYYLIIYQDSTKIQLYFSDIEDEFDLNGFKFENSLNE